MEEPMYIYEHDSMADVLAGKKGIKKDHSVTPKPGLPNTKDTQHSLSGSVLKNANQSAAEDSEVSNAKKQHSGLSDVANSQQEPGDAGKKPEADCGETMTLKEKWNSSSERQRCLVISVIVAALVVAITFATLIYVLVDNNKGTSSIVETFPRWKQRDHYPNHCVTPVDAIDIILHCHGMASVPNFNKPHNDIVHAFMSDNTWTHITDRKFSNFPSLVFLNLSNDGITQIASTAFQGLSRLEILNLAGNAIDSLSHDIFSDLTSLQILNLQNNAMTQLPESLFRNLASLIELNVAQNMITAIAPSHFVSLNALERLFLQENHISSILLSGTFTNLKFEQYQGYLNLSHNRIREIKYGSFSPSASLNVLDLRGNPLFCESMNHIPTEIIISHVDNTCEHATSLTCDKLNCSTNGMCMMLFNGTFFCQCDPGFTGSLCTDDIDECDGEPCMEELARCQNTEGSFHCLCLDECLGKLTSLRTTLSAGENSRDSSTVILTMLLILAIVIIFCAVYRKNAAKQKAFRQRPKQGGAAKKKIVSKSHSGNRRMK